MNQEGIDVSLSSIYNNLKRHGLQNREKRHAKIKARQIPEVWLLEAVDRSPPSEEAGLSLGKTLEIKQPEEEKPQVALRADAERLLAHRNRWLNTDMAETWYRGLSVLTPIVI